MCGPCYDIKVRGKCIDRTFCRWSWSTDIFQHDGFPGWNHEAQKHSKNSISYLPTAPIKFLSAPNSVDKIWARDEAYTDFQHEGNPGAKTEAPRCAENSDGVRPTPPIECLSAQKINGRIWAREEAYTDFQHEGNPGAKTEAPRSARDSVGIWPTCPIEFLSEQNFLEKFGPQKKPTQI